MQGNHLPKIMLVLSLIIFGEAALAQTDSAGESSDLEDYYSQNRGISIRVDAGAFLPLPNLNKTLRMSPHLAVYFGVRVSKKYRVDVGTSIFIPVNSGTVEYLLPDTVLRGKPLLSGTMGFWLTRMESIKGKYFWDNRVGTGLGFFQTDIPTNKPKEDNDRVYGSETLFFNLGTGIRKVVFTRRSIGLAVNYFYVPYNAFEKNLGADFGSQYLTTSISFHF